MNAQDRLHQCEGFDWDEGNKDKNWESHQVTASECEEVFFIQPLIVVNDEGHSINKIRYYALGQTMAGRKLGASGFCVG